MGHPAGLLIIGSWCGLRAELLLFILARGIVLRGHHQEHHAAAQFFREFSGTVVQFEADPVRRAVARRVRQSAVYLEHGGHGRSDGGQHADTEHRQAADGYREKEKSRRDAGSTGEMDTAC
jgi:hypothetical protein